MIDLADINIGDKVHYRLTRCDSGEWSNGIVKKILKDHDNVFVVYHCAGEWEKYESYPGVLTNLRDLHPGWQHKDQTNAEWCEEHGENELRAKRRRRPGINNFAGDGNG